jgi:hypothetical protein
MSFAWSRKVARVIPAGPPSSLEQSTQTIVTPEVIEIIQQVKIPTVDDKISSIEHKNGESLADACKEDDEDDEVQGDLQEGGRAEESDYGSEEVVARVEDKESSSPRTSLKK